MRPDDQARGAFPPAGSPRRRRAQAAVLLAGTGMAALLLFAYDPSGSRLFPRCPFNAVTGLHCPGCGSARALHHLLHGRLATAFSYNPLAVLMLPILAYAACGYLVRWFGLKRLPTVRMRPAWAWALLVVIVLYWVLRNVPAWPFTLLAPGG
jgi:hypothetical protein